MQLVFFKGENREKLVLEQVLLYFKEEFVQPIKLKFDRWIPNSNTTQKDLIDKIETYEIELKIDYKLTDEDSQIAYVSNSNVTIIFVADDKIYKLDSIDLTNKSIT